MKPEGVFENHRDSLMKILRAADVYSLLKIDEIRGIDSGGNVAREVIAKSGSSTLILSKHFFLSKEEQALFERDQYVSGICQHVVQSSYSAIENYLVNFFIVKLKEKVNDEEMSNTKQDRHVYVYPLIQMKRNEL